MPSTMVHLEPSLSMRDGANGDVRNIVQWTHVMATIPSRSAAFRLDWRFWMARKAVRTRTKLIDMTMRFFVYLRRDSSRLTLAPSADPLPVTWLASRDVVVDDAGSISMSSGPRVAAR